jgi:hypothetical protein
LLGNGEPVALKGQDALRRRVALNYRLVEAEGARGPWKVTTTAYSYIVDATDRGEVFAYQWNPHGAGKTPRPHVHFRCLGELRSDWAHIHFPTGRVALEDVVRTLIEEMSVEPRRSDWNDVLDETQQDFERWRTWGGQAPPPAP